MNVGFEKIFKNIDVLDGGFREQESGIDQYSCNGREYDQYSGIKRPNFWYSDTHQNIFDRYLKKILAIVRQYFTKKLPAEPPTKYYSSQNKEIHTPTIK